MKFGYEEKIIVAISIPTVCAYLIGDLYATAVLLSGNFVLIAIYTFKDYIQMCEKFIKLIKKPF